MALIQTYCTYSNKTIDVVISANNKSMNSKLVAKKDLLCFLGAADILSLINNQNKWSEPEWTTPLLTV